MPSKYQGNHLSLGTDEAGQQIILTEAQRRLHTFIPGTTGAGKSRLLQSMIWQDIEQWEHSRHGILLLDPDAEIYDGLMRRLARQPEYWRRPIIQIDLRRYDHVIGYNLLRRRPDDDTAVVALNLLEAIITAFGDVDVMAKPTLYRTAVTILRALIEANLSIAHAPMVLDPAQSALRARLAEFITDPIALANFSRINSKSINDKTGRQFDDETLAFANRMFGALSNQLLRHMFGQTGASLDFDQVLHSGAIVLVSLATEGNKISDTDARLVGALLLADLWQAAKRRGKRGAGEVRGFYVYADEFQTMLSPTIAAQLSRARGYGLYFTLATQLVSQLRDNGGIAGDAIYHAVIGNTANKIVFRASSDEDDLRPLTRAVFLDQVDINRVKDEIDGYQVVGHEEVRRVLHGGSETINTQQSRSVMDAHTDADGHVNGAQSGHGYGNSSGASVPNMLLGDDPAAGMTTEGTFETVQDTTSEQDTSSSADTHAVTVSKAGGRARSKNYMESIQPRPIIEKRVTSRTFESVENQLFAFDQRLYGLPDRHAYARLHGVSAPVLMCTRDVPDVNASSELVERLRRFTLSRLPFALPMAVAVANLLENDRTLDMLPEVADEADELVGFARKRTPVRANVKETDHAE